jgi:hypothetical protein
MGIRGATVAMAATFFVIMAALSLALSASASQTLEGPTAKQEVPNNPAEHIPPVQPIPYSHKSHLALGLTCPGCHKNPDPGKLMTFPATSICMGCHAKIAKNKPTIQKLTSFAKSQQPVPWARVYMVLPGVNWTHRKHVEAGIKCEGCHGPVAELEAMSEVTSVTTMAVCLDCHKAHNAPTACQTCHAWPAPTSE